MATFNDMVVTNDGKVQYAKALAGKTIKFCRAKLGDGTPENQEATLSMTDIIKPTCEAAIKSIDVTHNGIAIISIAVNNFNFTEPKGIKEVGLFCLDPDTQTEVMYSYCYSPNDIDVIPAITHGEVTWEMNLQLYITNATGETTQQQTGLIDYKPTFSVSLNEGYTNEFITVSATNGKYILQGVLVTAFYNITGSLTNMKTAESGLNYIKIKIPHTSQVNSIVTARMIVTKSDSTKVTVDVIGEIRKNSDSITIIYLGTEDGSFDLKLTAQYAI